MPRSISCLLACFLVTTATKPACADKVYDVIPYDGFASGWSVGGSITTDGTIGPIDDSQFVDYSISVSYPGGSFTLTPGNSFSVVYDVGHVPIIATESDLIFSPSALALLPAQLYFSGFSNNEWVGFSGGFDPDPGFILVSNDQGGSDLSLPEFAQPFSIARVSVVPEPSAAWLLSVGCTVATVLPRRRRCCNPATPTRFRSVLRWA